MLCPCHFPFSHQESLFPCDHRLDNFHGSSGSKVGLQSCVYILPCPCTAYKNKTFLRCDLPLSHVLTKCAFRIKLFTFKTFLFL